MNKLSTVIDTEGAEAALAALDAVVKKYINMIVDGCDCSLCESYRERVEKARAALANMTSDAVIFSDVEKTAAEVAEEIAAEETTEAHGNGFRVNAAAVINTFTVSEAEDMAQIREQLYDAPLFCSLSARDIYKKRAPIMYHLTNGAEVLEAMAVSVSDYFTRFRRQLEIALNDLYHETTYADWMELIRFWRNDSIIRRGILENKIAPEVMEAFSIRSPKFSKHLIKTFGEKSEIVKLFNDRPKAADIEKQTAEVVEGKKVIVSNLASNVMKMTAGNDFSSCQDYTYDDISDLGYLQKLPSAVHDETMSIAYLVDESDSYEHPYMLARVLISPLEYNGNLFYIGFNLYGNNGNAEVLKSSLKNLYGERFLFADDMYNTENMHEWEYSYDYKLRVDFEYEEYCYLCEGSGEVTATVRYHDYEFECECPHCEGKGRECGEYGDYPYVNNASFVRYGYYRKTTYADKKVLDAILTAEAYGGNDLFSFEAEA